MTRDDMRKRLQAGFDRLLGLPRLLLGKDDRAMVYDQQAYWQQASDDQIDRLLALYPTMAEVERLHAAAPEK